MGYMDGWVGDLILNAFPNQLNPFHNTNIRIKLITDITNKIPIPIKVNTEIISCKSFFKNNKMLNFIFKIKITTDYIIHDKVHDLNFIFSITISI